MVVEIPPQEVCSPKRNLANKELKIQYCVPSSFSYACIDSIGIQSHLSKYRLSVDIAIIILAIMLYKF